MRVGREEHQGEPWAVVRVRDNGRGIPPDMLEKVFELFVQMDKSLDRSGGGLGIGLTLVRKLVGLHGGRVSAHSEGPGRGTEFVVRLPLLRQKAPDLALAPPAPPPPQAPPGALRVLVVEDGEDVREMMKELLELMGHEVEVATDGLEGVEKMLALRPDVALVDVGLPGIDGYEVARRVRAAPGGGQLSLIALTGYGGQEARTRALDAGFDLHLVKPVNVNDLPRVLESARRPKEAR